MSLINEALKRTRDSDHRSVHTAPPAAQDRHLLAGHRRSIDGRDGHLSVEGPHLLRHFWPFLRAALYPCRSVRAQHAGARKGIFEPTFA